MSCVVGSKIHHWDVAEECTDRPIDGGPRMRYRQRFLASSVALIVVGTTSAYAPSLAEEPTFITVGPPNRVQRQDSLVGTAAKV